MVLFELLHLAHDPENLNLTEMKKKAKNKIKEQSSGSGQYSNGTTEEIICVTFEKQIGRIQDFKFYYGRNSRGTTGLFIRTVSPQSPLAGLITPQDQIIRVNDKDIKNSEIDSFNHILDNLSGTVRLEVARIKYYEGIGKQVLEETIVSKNPTLVPTDKQTSVQRSTNRDWGNRQHEEPTSARNWRVAKGRRKLLSGRLCQEKEVQHKKMATEMPPKNIDDIKDFDEMMKGRKLLHLDLSNAENLNLTEMKEKAKKKIEEQSSGSGQYSNGTTRGCVLVNCKFASMSSEEDDAMPQRRDSVSNLARFFHKALSESNENKPTKRSSSQQGTTTHIEEEIICVTFEKQIGRIQDFKFYHGRNSRGTTGLFIRTVSPQSPLAGLITPQDQIIRVNDKDIKNSEIDSFNHILDNLSGTVRLEVARIKYYEGIGKQVLEETIVSKNPTLVPTDKQTSVQRSTNRDWGNRQHEEPTSAKNWPVAKGSRKLEITEEEGHGSKCEQPNQALIHQLQQENVNMNTEVLKVREENKDLRIEIQKLQESHNINKIQWETEIYELRQDNIDKNNKNQKLERDFFNINSEIQRLREENITINNEMQNLRWEKANMNDEMQRVQEENNDLTIEIEQLEENYIFSSFERGGSVAVSKQELGRGAYGKVFIGDFYGTKVAVKEYHEIILSPHNEELLSREIRIALQCRHPNLLQFICATQNDQDHLLIVTELMDMALRTLLEQRARKISRLEYHEIKLISLDVARGLSYLHSKTPSPVIHRDISSANILLWIENQAVKKAKISDYGSANFMQACNTANPGAAIYAAPEANRAQHDPKIDVFSYGLLVCEMSICQLPQQDIRQNQIKRIPHGGIRELVKCCTEWNPQQRPPMHAVIGFLEQME